MRISPEAQILAVVAQWTIVLAVATYFAFRLVYVFDSLVPDGFNSQRFRDGRLLRQVLADFKRDYGRYPILSDGQPFGLLRADLVDLKFLREIPNDPLFLFRGEAAQYRYMSDGSHYTLLLRLQSVKAGPHARLEGYCAVGHEAGAKSAADFPPCPLD